MGLPCLGEAEHEPGHNPLQPRLPRQAYRHRAAEDAPQAELSACFSSSQSCLCPTSPHCGPAQPCAGQGALAARCSAQHEAARSFHSP